MALRFEHEVNGVGSRWVKQDPFAIPIRPPFRLQVLEVGKKLVEVLRAAGKFTPVLLEDVGRILALDHNLPRRAIEANIRDHVR
jgi:hypothetical protein